VIIHKIKEIESMIGLICDKCDRKVMEEDDSDFEFGEFYMIFHRCGYGSIHRDGSTIECDLCQYCLNDLIKDFRRIDTSDVPLQGDSHQGL